MLLVTQAYLLAGDFQPVLFCHGRKQVSGSETQDFHKEEGECFVERISL